MRPGRLLILAFFLFGLLPGVPAQAQQSAPASEIVLRIGSREASVKGEPILLTTAPTQVNGTTLVPLRFVAEALGLQVAWDPAGRSITVRGEPKIVMHLGQTAARVDGQEKHLPVPPVLRDDTTLVPLRFLAEALNREVEYRPATKEIFIRPKERLPVAVIVLEKNRVTLGEKVAYTSASYSPDGLPIVEERWGNPPPWPAPGQYTLTLEVRDSRGLWSMPARATVEVLPPPNRPPVARFQVTKTVIAQGERVEYVDDSYDPDGDAIVERRWEGKEEAFFRPGPQTVSLRVKDARGLWSEPYRVTLTVTEEKLMDELTYRLRYALPGEKFSIPGRNLREFSPAEIEEEPGGPMLLLSNSPEKVVAPGILYRDVARDTVRVFYWHVNGAKKPLRLLLLAQNHTAAPARISVRREGTAGPEADAFGVGRRAMLRYLGTTDGPTFTLAPGELVILNAGQYRPARPGEIIHGIYDLMVEGEVTLAVVALAPEANVAQTYPLLEPLPADQIHDRGTFRSADRKLTVRLPGGRPATLVLPGSIVGLPLTGYDALSGGPTVNKGNYGVLYHLRLRPQEDVVLLLNPRGGGLAGAVGVNDFLVPMPRVGFGLEQSEVIKGGLLPANREGTVLCMPPGGSSLPLNLLFWPIS